MPIEETPVALHDVVKAGRARYIAAPDAHDDESGELAQEAFDPP